MSEQPNHVYAVILAGGSGTRFWPKSRLKTPKQLCNIGGGELSMIEKTLARLDGFIPPSRRIVVTHHEQAELTKQMIGDKCKYLIAEPEAKNTAAALTLAALEIETIHGNSNDHPVMVSLHADHIIRNEDEFRHDLSRAVNISEHGYLTLMGVTPAYPETGYGYIECGEPLKDTPDKSQGFSVASFREKPELETAQKYIEQGSFFWNSGYFIWQTKTLLSELQTYLPNTLDLLSNLTENRTKLFSEIPTKSLAPVYASLQNIAIDPAVLEVSKKVALIKTDFGWYDIGSWDALAKCFETDSKGNLSLGDTFLIDCQNTTVDSDGPFVACIGLKDVVVVHNKGAILVCPSERAQEVKNVVAYLKENGRSELL